MDTLLDVDEDSSLTDSASEPLEDTAASDISLTDGADTIGDSMEDTVPAGCAFSTALFCVDFDFGGPPEAAFGSKDIVLPGHLSLEASGAHSFPNLLLASAAPSGSDSAVRANVLKNFTAASTDTPVRVEMYIKLESVVYPSSSGIANLFKLERSAGAGDGVTFSIGDSGLFVERIAGDYERFPITAYMPKANVWMHVRMDVVLQVTGGSVKVWIDDMTTPVVDRSSISTAIKNATGRLFTVGLYAEKQTAPFRARFDDIKFTFE